MAIINAAQQLYAGDDVDLDLTLTDQAGAALDLGGATISVAFSSVYDEVPLFVKSTAPAGGVTITPPPEAGLCVVRINSGDTKGLGGQPYKMVARVVQATLGTTLCEGRIVILRTALTPA